MIGRAAVRVGCGGQVVEDLELVVVGGNGPSLLGRDWLWGSCGWIGGDLNDSIRRRDTQHPRSRACRTREPLLKQTGYHKRSCSQTSRQP